MHRVCLCLLFIISTAKCDVVLTATPDSLIPGVTDSLVLRCGVGPNSQEVNRVMVMQIEKVNGIHIRPLVSMATGEDAKLDVTYPAGTTATVSGVIDPSPQRSYLELTLTNPTEEDSGEYLCVMSVLDRSYLLERLSVQTHVNLTEPDPEQITVMLLSQVKSLQEQVTALTSHGCGCSDTHSNSGGVATSDAGHGKQVAFLSYPSTRRSFDLGTLRYDSATVNIGGAYDPSSSIFTAPVNGTYVFMTSVSTNDYKTISELKVNGNSVAQLATVSDDQSSNSVILDLEQGDRVWLEGVYTSSNTTVLYADKDSTFSGFLLYPY